MTIDCGQSGPAKYRTQADNNVEQTCFFSQKKKDRLFDRFTARNHNHLQNLMFIIETTDSTNTIKEKHYLMTNYLKKVKCSIINAKIRKKMTETEQQTQQLDLIIEMGQKPEKDHDFSFLEENKENLMSTNNVKRRVKPYTSS